MPPLKGIDRGLTGEALKALEESGHGRRVAVVDTSYNIPRWAQVIDYRGATSADALKGILELVPVEPDSVALMSPDILASGNALHAGDEITAQKAHMEFEETLNELEEAQGQPIGNTSYLRTEELEAEYKERYATQPEKFHGDFSHIPDRPDIGFYSLANNEAEDTLFIRTPDALPYACATFVVGHSQTAE